MFGKILVPLDGSVLAERALPYAIQVARQSGAILDLLRVVDTETGVLESSAGYLATKIRIATDYLARLEQSLTDPANQRGIPMGQLRTYIVYGEPATEITNFASDCRVDLIVMTTHGRNGWHQSAMGSEVATIVKDKPTSIMLIDPFDTTLDQFLPQTVAGSDYAQLARSRANLTSSTTPVHNNVVGVSDDHYVSQQMGQDYIDQRDGKVFRMVTRTCGEPGWEFIGNIDKKTTIEQRHGTILLVKLDR